MIQSNLVMVMKQKGVKVEELLTRTGLARQTITNARGTDIGRCRLNTLERIAEALDVTPSDLYTYIPNDPPDQE